ncbi:thyroid receptor-interacting protein 11 [Halyomorpha halys]|uniref:thyroid receptor-interacting protein 11 n=1 Tax=Halyomorpha halys TaxID=286706 RepID=UPI0006D4DCBB
MAWFGEGLSSLRGQLSNLAKGVLVEEEESEKNNEVSNVDSSVPATLSDVQTAGPSWADAEVDTFIGQEPPKQKDEITKTAQESPNKGNVDKDVATMIPKGIANFFQQITTIPEGKLSTRGEKETQTDATLINTNDNVIQRLTEQNAQLNSEIDSLRRMVRDLESQVALSQDENANLSTGLEALDIQHQEAIERILTVRDESQRQLEHISEELRLKNEEFTKIVEQNNMLKKEVEDLNQELLEGEALAQENARLRERISATTVTELPPIEENSALEENVRTLEFEVLVLRESRDNLERETNTLLSQIRQRDAQLRQVDARVEEIVNEKEIKEREMTQIVFECNSLRQELKSSLEKVEHFENILIPLQEENKALKAELEVTKNDLFSARDSLEAAKREANLSKDESETLKSELESLKEELGGEEAKAAQDNKELLEVRKMVKAASSEVEVLKAKLLNAEDEYNKAKIKYETDQTNFELERQALQKELDALRDISREYGIQKDIFREKDLELKRRLENAEVELCSVKCLLDEEKEQCGKEIEGLKELIKQSKRENGVLRSKLDSYNENDFKLQRCLNELENLQKENKKLMESFEETGRKNEALLNETSNKELELSELKVKLNSFENNDLRYKEVIDELQKSLEITKEELKNSKDQIILLCASNEKNSQVDKTTEVEDEDKIIQEKEKLASEVASLSESNKHLVKEIENLTGQVNLLKVEKDSLEKKVNILSQQNEGLAEGISQSVEKEKEKYLNEIESLSTENEVMHKKLEELKEKCDTYKNENVFLDKKLSSSLKDLEVFHEQLKRFGGSFEGVEKLSSEVTQLSHQVDHFKDELKDAYEEKVRISEELSAISLERGQLVDQVQLLRRELDNMIKLKEEIVTLNHNLQIKSSEVVSFEGEVKRLQSALNTQLVNNEALHKEKNSLKERCDNIFVEMQNKMAYIEEVEKVKNKEVDGLKQEIENLKTQLEFASQLLQDVERQEGEGQPSGESNSQKSNPELQEELTRLSAALLKEQTDCKLIKNQLEDTTEKLEKAENQLKTLKNHLVNVEDSYISELSTAEEKLRETQAMLQSAEERARTSSTAYTSASIRSNQQVEALREQVRLLTEHKEKLEAEVSKAEDAVMKQSATVTRLQAVLHQFQRDKQQDIEFETERIRRDLELTKKIAEERAQEMKILQEQLKEAKMGLVAGQRLSEELARQQELVVQSKAQVAELTEKLKAKEEKVNDLSCDSKVDRQLVKNLIVGYVTSPADLKSQILGVLGQVLSLSKEERQKVGLEPGGRQQSLSEAFVRFLQAESQPRTEVILPLSVPSEPPSSRKSSLLTQEVPVLPHFPVGRNPGSILKDVLQERRPE